MLSCKDITEKANEYVDKELPLVARVKFHIHLFMCVNCRRYVTQLKTTILALGRMRHDTNTEVEDSRIESIIDLLKTESGAKQSGSQKVD